MTKVSAWLLASRPRTLTATLAPILVGSALALESGAPVSYLLILCALVSTFALQVTSNLVNDVADFKKGTDTDERLGPARACAQGWLTPREVWIGTGLCILLAVASGLPLMLHAGLPLVVLGALSVLAAVAYTAGPFPLAYLGLGEVFVFLFFGHVAVAGLFYALTLRAPTAEVYLAASQVGLLSVTMIAINNLRDVEGDRKNHKRTLAARFGEGFIRFVINGALLGPYLLGACWYLCFQTPKAFALPFVALPFALHIVRGLKRTPPSRAMNAFLGKASLHLLLFGLLLSGALLWS